jgi:hypothetical protein
MYTLDPKIFKSFGVGMDIGLSQSEADTLLSMGKYRLDDTRYTFPGSGGVLKIPLNSMIKFFFAPREIFDKAGSKRSVPNEESIVSNYG